MPRIKKKSQQVSEPAIEKVAETRTNKIIQITDSHTHTRTHIRARGSLTAILEHSKNGNNKTTNTPYKTKINLPKECWQKSAVNASNTHYFFLLLFFLLRRREKRHTHSLMRVWLVDQFSINMCCIHTHQK